MDSHISSSCTKTIMKLLFALFYFLSTYFTISTSISSSMFSFILVFLPLLFLLALSPVSYACSLVSLSSVCLSFSVCVSVWVFFFFSSPFSHLLSPPLILPPLQKHRPLVLRAPTQSPHHPFQGQGLTRKSSFSQLVFFSANSPSAKGGVWGGRVSAPPQGPFAITPGLMGPGPSLGSSCPCKYLKQRE